ncbi:MAG: histone deacetylase [Deltaproteobacteria bacterium]|nr:histone deacetylase [Deltaproteobacteria bacterium]
MWWWYRWRALKRINKYVGLWYHRDYAAPAISINRQVAHMQTDRAERALLRLTQLGLLRREAVNQAPLAEFADLNLVHSLSYLEQVTNKEVLGGIFGLLPEQVEIDAWLTAQRRAVGGTMEAAFTVARGDMQIGFNLGGGFHHASPNNGAGFCIFNDVAVAIKALRARGFSSPIAIIDLDFHQGNGNLEAFYDDTSVFVLSIHGSSWTSLESSNCRNIAISPGIKDQEYLAMLEDILKPSLIVHGAKLIFYIAGADVLAGDQLGDFNLSPKGVFARDRYVINTAAAIGASVVVTMAGGYSPGAWQCTANFIRWMLSGITQVDRSPAEKLRYHFEQISREIDPWQLQRFDDFILTESDFLPGNGRRPQNLLLEYYSAAGIEFALERYGLLGKIAACGFYDLRVTVDSQNYEAQIVRIDGISERQREQRHLLLELVLSKRTIPATKHISGPPLLVLYIEWLRMQNPTLSFSPTKPRLPLQEYPGLGLAQEMHQFLVEMGKRLRFEGILIRPAHYHTAVLAGRVYHFLDPRAEGCFRALRRLLANVTLANATNLVDQGRIKYRDNSSLIWEASELMLPSGDRLANYFASPTWQKSVFATAEKLLGNELSIAND